MENEFKIPWSKPSFDKEELDSLQKVISSGWLTQGKKTSEFEINLSDYLSSNAVVVNSGSSALTCALLAHGLKPGDKVLVPNFTFFATYSVPKMLGANVILSDVDEFTLNMTPEIVEEIVKTEDVKFVIIVDVAGLPLDIEAFTELSHRYNFILIEDAAEALGSEYKNKKIGSFDHTSIFSFHIAKQITTIEGGCVSSHDKNIIKKITQIRDQGRSISGEYIHSIIGSNFRITDLQSTLGIEQLNKIDSFLKTRNKIALENLAEEVSGISGEGGIIPSVIDQSDDSQVEKFVSEVVSEHKQIDVLVNSAYGGLIAMTLHFGKPQKCIAF